MQLRGISPLLSPDVLAGLAHLQAGQLVAVVGEGFPRLPRRLWGQSPWPMSAPREVLAEEGGVRTLLEGLLEHVPVDAFYWSTDHDREVPGYLSQVRWQVRSWSERDEDGVKDRGVPSDQLLEMVRTSELVVRTSEARCNSPIVLRVANQDTSPRRVPARRNSKSATVQVCGPGDGEQAQRSDAAVQTTPRLARAFPMTVAPLPPNSGDPGLPGMPRLESAVAAVSPPRRRRGVLVPRPWSTSATAADEVLDNTDRAGPTVPPEDKHGDTLHPCGLLETGVQGDSPDSPPPSPASVYFTPPTTPALASTSPQPLDGAAAKTATTTTPTSEDASEAVVGGARVSVRPALGRASAAPTATITSRDPPSVDVVTTPMARPRDDREDLQSVCVAAAVQRLEGGHLGGTPPQSTSTSARPRVHPRARVQALVLVSALRGPSSPPVTLKKSVSFDENLVQEIGWQQQSDDVDKGEPASPNSLETWLPLPSPHPRVVSKSNSGSASTALPEASGEYLKESLRRGSEESGLARTTPTPPPSPVLRLSKFRFPVVLPDILPVNTLSLSAFPCKQRKPADGFKAPYRSVPLCLPSPASAEP